MEELNWAICLNNLKKSYTILECGHKFYIFCINKIIENDEMKCPLCRQITILNDSKECCICKQLKNYDSYLTFDSEFCIECYDNNIYYKIHFGKYKNNYLKHLFDINDKNYIKWCIETFRDKTKWKR